jgi:hypothetical protein
MASAVDAPADLLQSCMKLVCISGQKVDLFAKNGQIFEANWDFTGSDTLHATDCATVVLA